MRFPDRSPVLDKHRAPIGPEILSSTGAGAWRKAPMAFPDSSSVLDKFRSAIVNSVPEWEKETQSIHPKWLEHHQSGHLVKDPGCPVCMEEAGSKVNHRRKKADRHPGIMRCDLAAFEASADGHKYCLVAAVTIEVDSVSKLLPFFVPMPKKDAVCATAALKEALTVRIAIYTKLRVLGLFESRQMEVVSSPIRKYKIYAGRRTLYCLTLPHISLLPMA